MKITLAENKKKSEEYKVTEILKVIIFNAKIFEGL